MAKRIFVLIIFVIGLGLTSACSKSLLPPEVQAEGSMVESEMAAGMTESEAASDSSEAESGGSGADPEPAAGFFQEESLSEMDTSSGQAVVGTSLRERLEDLVSSSRDFGSAEQGMPGDGATGSFSAEPFSGSEGGSGMAGNGMAGNGMTVPGMDSGDQEARRLPYSSSDSLKDIHFAFDRYELDDQSRAVLRENATYLKSNPESRIEIQGHCDERGTNNYNIALGQRRAHSTKSYLSAQGIDVNRIHIVTYGEEKPFCFDSNENCWWQNRRAHFLVAE